MSGVTILAIETSCDETGVAVVRRDRDTVTVLAEAVASQVDIHAATGGVVPEVAAREHVTALQPMVRSVLVDSGVAGEALTAVAVTVGPGLAPALVVGVAAARALAYAWGKPVVPVHHLEGHVYSALFTPANKAEFSISNFQFPKNEVFPALALIVSGGHTQLILVRDHVSYEVIGSTRDDAAGEAFDKVARLLGLGYPGGPAISGLARHGNPAAFAFARPMLRSESLDFSFSGLKTEVLYAWRELSDQEQEKQRADVAASFEAAVVETLVTKTMRAVAGRWPRRLLLAGGVAANARLRTELAAAAKTAGLPLAIAPEALCGDNAVMIGLAAVYAYAAGRQVEWQTVAAQARLPIAAPGQL